MISVKKEGLILRKRLLPFEREGVLNPAVIRVGDVTHLFYRAVAKGSYSTIGYCQLNGPLEVVQRSDLPVLAPVGEEEAKGIEDPRIVLIDGVFYLTYTAFDGFNALGALATSSDLKSFDRYGIIVPVISFPKFKRLAEGTGKLNEKYSRFAHDKMEVLNGKTLVVWDKDLIFFPRRIHNKLYFLHRIKPDIQITCINELSELSPAFWNDYLVNFRKNIAMVPIHKHEVSYIGGGCPPVETPQGWLIIYHGVHDTTEGYVYSACAALLDLVDPKIEIARLPYPLFKPEADWELSGQVNNVCFPSGTALFDNTLYIYYGAADEQIACASVNLTALVDELLTFRL